jgi:hypothetical protein
VHVLLVEAEVCLLVVWEQLLVVHVLLVEAEVCFLPARVLLMMKILLMVLLQQLLVVMMKILLMKIAMILLMKIAMILLMKIAMILLMKIAMILLIEVERPYQDTSYDLHHRDSTLAHYPYYVHLEATQMQDPNQVVVH